MDPVFFNESISRHFSALDVNIGLVENFVKGKYYM
jgi:hypothetical protein